VVSDYPLGTPPDAVNFPPRNRIISGLAKGVVVVEADEDSGALITTDFAAEQGRDVFAVPGNLNQRGSRGTNRLIQQGAKLVMNVTDILEELNLAQAAERQAVQAALPLDHLEQQVLEQLAAGPAHVDDLCAQLSLPVAQVSSALALMELKGLVRALGGMSYAAREPGPEYDA
jgi:DNA processing protein